MFKWFLIFILVIVIILLTFYNILQWTEDKILYYPSKKSVWKPKVPYEQVYLNINDSEDICYHSKDRRSNAEYLSGWHFNNFSGAKTILFCHGNTGNITYRKYIINICHKFGLNLLVFDYRGFGKSDSFPYKLFFKEDGECAYEYLRYHCKISSRKIIVWGESVGGVSAAWIGSKYRCGGLILMCTFSSMDDILTYKYDGTGQQAIKLITGLAGLRSDMLRIKDYLKSVECPVIIIHSSKDELIPYSCSWINYHNIKHDNKLHIRIKGGHSSPYIKSSQFKQVFEFCDMPLDNCEDIDISGILKDLRTFAKRHNNFID